MVISYLPCIYPYAPSLECNRIRLTGRNYFLLFASGGKKGDRAIITFFFVFYYESLISASSGCGFDS
jgi:hypothetical protein